jgi:hypothetical protein
MDLIFEGIAFRVVLLEPFRTCIARAPASAGPNAVSFGEGSNTRTTFRFTARMMPMRANIVGPPVTPAGFSITPV